jgi:aspartate 1-decarboxylase
MLKSKIHGAKVTNLCLEYEGSITIDPMIMEAAKILPYEQVQVLNMNNAARFTTYVIKGEPEANQICLNGPAARLVKKGDTIMILAFCQITDDEINGLNPLITYLDEDNQIIEIKQAIAPFII